MAEARAKALLHDLTAEFELLLEQNSSFTAELAQLKAELHQNKASSAAAGIQMPRRGMMQQNLAFLRGRSVSPPPACHARSDSQGKENEHVQDVADIAESKKLTARTNGNNYLAYLAVPNKNAAASVNANSEPIVLSPEKSHPDVRLAASIKINPQPFVATPGNDEAPSVTAVSSEKNLTSSKGNSGPNVLCSDKDVELQLTGDEMRELHFGSNLSLKACDASFDDVGVSMARTRLWPAWEENAVYVNAKTSSSMRLARSMASDSNEAMEDYLKNVKYGAELRSRGCLQHLVARPSSPRQILWDMCSVVFMCLDVLLVPLQAFPLPQTDFNKVLDWSSVIFWTLDIPNNFFTGFHKDGVFEMRPMKIAKRYIHKLFFLDLSIVVVDWLVVANTSTFRENGFVRVVKSYRIARALRLVRVVRIAKLLNMLVELSDHIAFLHSDTIRIVIDIFKIILFILVASHFLACGWYAIGVIDELGEFGSFANNWVERFAQEQGGDPSVGYQYVTSLHWALTQFTPASMEIMPTNVAERIYALVVLLLAVVTFSSFVSSITSSMTRLRIMNIERSKQREDIRRYIVDHRMTLGVGNRINQFLRKQDSELQRRVHEEDVCLFKFLPEALRVDMHREVFLPVLVPHPFFYHYYEFLDDASLATICHTAMRERALGQGEYVFNYGESATHMFFLHCGKAEYSLGAALHDDLVSVGANSMLSEAVLWIPWLHAGRLLVSKHVELAMLDSLVMQGILRGQPAAKPARLYALQFLERQLKHRELYTDLCTDMSDALEMAQLAWVDVERITEGTGITSRTVSDRRINRLRVFVKRVRNSFASVMRQ